MQRHEDVVLGREVVVERRLGEAQPFGDLPQRGAVEALLDEQVEGHIEDALPGRARLWRLIGGGLGLPRVRVAGGTAGPS